MRKYISSPYSLSSLSSSEDEVGGFRDRENDNPVSQVKDDCGESSDEFEQEMEKVATQLLKEATGHRYSESLRYKLTKTDSKKSVRFMGLEEPKEVKDDMNSKSELIPEAEPKSSISCGRNKEFYDPVYFDSSDEEGRLSW